MLFLSLVTGRQYSLRTENHHNDKNEPEYHPLIFRRLELRWQLAERIGAEKRDRQLGTGLTQIVEPNRDAL